jgi:nicotinamidase-related amidase
MVVIFWSAFIVINMQEFFREPSNELSKKEQSGKERILKNEKIELHQNVPEAYWQWYYQVYKKSLSD